MNQETLTLYKLIVLYLLDKVTFPLTKAQISDFILEKEYTNFLTLQQVFSELTDSGLAVARSIGNRTHLQITDEGRDTLRYFENRVSDAIKDEIREYLNKHEVQMRNESSIQGNYYKSVSGEYEVQLIAKEKEINLVDIKLSVPTKELALSICDNWQRKNKEIYQYLTLELF